MIEAYIEVTDNGLIDLYADKLENAEEFVADVAFETATALEPYILEDFQKEPDSVAKPVAWTTPRQWRFMMRQIRLRNIVAPYVRGHTLSRSWELHIDRNPSVFVYLINPVYYSDWVVGRHQQPMFKASGWFYAPALADEWARKLIDAVDKDLLAVWKSAWGKR